MTLFVRRRWPAVAAALAVVAAIVLAVALLNRDSSPPGDPDVLETAEPLPTLSTPAPVPISTVLAAAADVKAYDDTNVTASSVNVLSVVGPSAVWVGDTAADRVLVVLVSTEKPFSFAAGTALSFTGTVRLGSPEFGKALGLTGADDAEYRRQGAYVEITSYEQA